jgi:hypothetical protein
MIVAVLEGERRRRTADLQGGRFLRRSVVGTRRTMFSRSIKIVLPLIG